MSQLDVARLQFAMTSIHRFLFLPVTIGLAFLTAVLQTSWHRSGRDEYLRLTRFFGTLLVSTIAVARSAASGYPGRMPMAREMTSRPIDRTTRAHQRRGYGAGDVMVCSISKRFRIET